MRHIVMHVIELQAQNLAATSMEIGQLGDQVISGVA
jgi:hypothetical protein